MSPLAESANLANRQGLPTKADTIAPRAAVPEVCIVSTTRSAR